MKQGARVLLLVIVMAGSISADPYIDGFLQALYGANVSKANPTDNDQTVSETRFQLRFEEIGSRAEMFTRIDFVGDNADSTEFDIEIREAFLRARLGSFDFKIGRQILTWGTGDLIFINDLFAKDYRSFFVGRDDQYLKAPQTAIRAEWYAGPADLTVVWTPSFEPNRLPNGRTLSYFDPLSGTFVGDRPLPTKEPGNSFQESELAVRLARRVGPFAVAGYFYTGFYKNPVGLDPTDPTSPYVYPRLRVYGASLRGTALGGIVWVEGGYYESRDDRTGDNPFIQNSTAAALVGYERQLFENLTVNLQWQGEQILDYETYSLQQQQGGQFARDELAHLVTSRVTRLLYDELIMLSGFVFWSPSDEDIYARASIAYDYSDELTVAVGANLFHGEQPVTQFARFALNDNFWLKLTYGF